MRNYFKILWAALLGRPIIARCSLKSVEIERHAGKVLVIGNQVVR